jgi:hypothetical protein
MRIKMSTKKRKITHLPCKRIIETKATESQIVNFYRRIARGARRA